MGGVYEHVIRSVRKISRVLPKQLLLFRGGIANFGGWNSGNSQWPTNRGSPIDSEPLTSNHLLLLWSNLNLPPGVFSKNDLNCWCRWRQIHYLSDVFWRWLSEYIPNFRERQKWIRPRRNFAVGDLVLIAEERVHRSQWPFARVLEVYPGRNWFVRSVKVATKSSTFTRPISKLCFLEQESLLPTKDSTYFTWLSCCLLKLKGLWICAPDVHELWTLADLLQRL